MRISREFAAAGVVDGRIYVIGGCVVDTWAKSRNWAEVFDPKTERWDSVDSGKDDLLREKWMHGSAVVNKRIYVMADRNGVVYEPKTKKWESVESELDLGWRGRACVVNGILYCYDYVGNIRGFDVRNGAWKELRGVEKELPRFLCGATMANVGGKLVVVWERKGNVKEMEVWCAEIEVEENGEGELRGRVEWCDVVHKVPIGSSIVHCLAVSIFERERCWEMSFHPKGRAQIILASANYQICVEKETMEKCEGMVTISYDGASYLSNPLSHQDFGAHMTGSQNGHNSWGERGMGMEAVDLMGFLSCFFDGIKMLVLFENLPSAPILGSMKMNDGGTWDGDSGTAGYGISFMEKASFWLVFERKIFLLKTSTKKILTDQTGGSDLELEAKLVASLFCMQFSLEVLSSCKC
ncbi:hypothetical protein POTOM_028441 [Populus tomentosa]|uniref:FKB95-like N-terminal Kelch domain-containing protein n=1 Tax=Populus tomentosa TaxID=118781 RepID=A0A8X7ZG73_POPTO|nr:hypothetical protein POTOM_028441 [Populus tomentosa]